ncbi:AsmA family protein [Chitinimonas viridis]|uniref:AsmA family protein n=1 Tax=Chitinimonas viridis TaxID=664880 RepID=A0ABT8B3F6_9NEIS|nr:AsmA family protein [Chitinimonas viridis]MDN3576782.1 AsmA family protein [Chitinimonas viridis]
MPLYQIPLRLRRCLYVFAFLLAVVVAVPLFNLSALGDKLAADASDSLGRKVEIGALRLALLPRPNVTLENLTISEPDGRALFAHFESARFSLGWGGLVKGRAELVDARVEGLVVNAYQRLDGTLNIDDLLARRPKPGRVDWRPERVDLVSAALNWQDAHGATTRFRKLDLHALDPEGENGAVTVVGQLTAPDWGGGLRVDSKLRVDRAKLAARLKQFRLAINAQTPEWRDGRFELAGDLELGALPWRAQLQQVVAQATVQRGEQRWQAKLRTPALRGGEGGLATGEIEAEFGIKSRLSEIAGQLKLARLAAEPTGGLAADQARLTLQLLDDTQNAQLEIESPLRMGNWRTMELPAFTLTGSYRNKALPQGAIKLALAGRTAVDLERERFDWDSRGQLDGAPVTAQLSLEDFVSSRYAFALDLAKLDLTPYLPNAEAAPLLDPAQPLSLDWLSGLVARGEVRIGELDIGRFRVFNLQTHVDTKRRQLKLDPLRADIYGGQLNGKLLLEGGAKPRLHMLQTLTGMEVAALMSDTFGIDRLSGRGTLNLDITAPASSIAALRQGMSGRVDLMLTRGAIAGLDVGDVLRGLRTNLARLTGGAIPADVARRTRFSDLSARFVIKEGVAESRDLVIRAPFLNLAGDGRIDIGRGEVDYLLNATVRGGSGVPELDALKGVQVPIQISGPLASPSYKLDTTALREKLGNAAKPAAAAPKK